MFKKTQHTVQQGIFLKHYTTPVAHILCATYILFGCTLPLHAQTTPPAANTTSATAQAELERAKRLARIQRFDEAIPIAEESYLILDDPEILRILATWYTQSGDEAKALQLYDAYLAHPDVGEMSKERVRTARDEVYARIHGGALEETPKEDRGRKGGWQVQGAGLSAPSTVFLSLRGNYTHNAGASFTTKRGGLGIDAQNDVVGDWTHGGIGFGLGAGYFFNDRIAAVLHISNDWMSWEHVVPTPAFETTLYSGMRPEVTAESMILINWGLFATVEAGADFMILSEGAEPRDTSCDEACTQAKTIETGLHAWRPLVGVGVGYRTALSHAWRIGVHSKLRFVPTAFATQDAAREAPSFTDAAWMFQAGFGITWDLNPPPPSPLDDIP